MLRVIPGDRDAVRLGGRLTELAGLPRLAKLGIGVIALGLALDATVHAMGIVPAGSAAAFVVRQHLAHLTVLVGMVITLGGIVVAGVRQGRPVRPERRSSDAIR